MSHDHTHHHAVVPENPKTAFTSAFLFILLILALIIGFFAFAKSMSHGDDHGNASNDAHAPAGNHTNGHEDPHSYATHSYHNPNTYNATLLAGKDTSAKVVIHDTASAVVQGAAEAGEQTGVVAEEQVKEDTAAHH